MPAVAGASLEGVVDRLRIRSAARSVLPPRMTASRAQEGTRVRPLADPCNNAAKGLVSRQVGKLGPICGKPAAGTCVGNGTARLPFPLPRFSHAAAWSRNLGLEVGIGPNRIGEVIGPISVTCSRVAFCLTFGVFGHGDLGMPGCRQLPNGAVPALSVGAGGLFTRGTAGEVLQGSKGMFAVPAQGSPSAANHQRCPPRSSQSSSVLSACTSASQRPFGLGEQGRLRPCVRMTTVPPGAGSAANKIR